MEFPDGPRTFPWVQSYNWSREGGVRSFAVQSALMALEAWAHKRIEAGEAFETVLADVLGAGDAPAAYLLVAVDLVCLTGRHRAMRPCRFWDAPNCSPSIVNDGRTT